MLYLPFDLSPATYWALDRHSQQSSLIPPVEALPSQVVWEVHNRRAGLPNPATTAGTTKASYQQDQPTTTKQYQREPSRLNLLLQRRGLYPVSYLVQSLGSAHITSGELALGKLVSERRKLCLVGIQKTISTTRSTILQPY